MKSVRQAYPMLFIATLVLMPTITGDDAVKTAHPDRQKIIIRKTNKTDLDINVHLMPRSPVEKIVLHPQEGSSAQPGLTRNAWLFRKPDAKYTVLMCHGFMCCKTDIRFLKSLFFKDSKCNVMFIDFRAHGENAKDQICTFGRDEVYDILAAVDFIRHDPQLKKLPLISYALSMGAVASINAQSQHPDLFDGAIWDCPFDSTTALITRCIEHLKITVLGYSFELPGRSFLKKYAYNKQVQSVLKQALKTVASLDSCQIDTVMVPINTVEAASNITIPTFLITCKKDMKAPPAAVKQIYDALKGPKQLWITGGRGHYDSVFYNPEQYVEQVRAFVDFIQQTVEQRAKGLAIPNREIMYEDPEEEEENL